MKRLLPILFTLALAACGSKEAKQIEQSEETTAQIEAALMAGRSDARRIVNMEFRDSMEFHDAILHANARRSEYTIANRQRCRQAYDSAFMSTIRIVRPDLDTALQQPDR